MLIDFLELFVHLLVSPFKTQARLEAEVVLLRHQLNVLRRQVSNRDLRWRIDCSSHGRQGQA